MYEDVLCYIRTTDAGGLDEKLLKAAWKNVQRRMARQLVRRSELLRETLAVCDRKRAETGVSVLEAYLKETAGITHWESPETEDFQRCIRDLKAWRRSLKKIAYVPFAAGPMLSPAWTKLDRADWDPEPSKRAEVMTRLRSTAQGQLERLDLAVSHIRWVIGILPVLEDAMEDTVDALRLVRQQKGDDASSYSEVERSVLEKTRDIARIVQCLAMRRLADPGGAGKEKWENMQARTERVLRGGHFSE